MFAALNSTIRTLSERSSTSGWAKRIATTCSYSSFDIKFDKTLPFKLLDGSIDRNNIQYQQAIERSQKLENHFTKLRDKVLASGGQRAIQRHTQVNKKILPRQRVLSLLDEGTELFDLCNLSGLGLDYGDIPGAGSVLGIGRVYGRYCLIHANESTIKSGAIYPVSVTKHLRAQQISRENRLPCIYIVDSAGAFLPLQSEVFPGQDHGGRVFFNEAVLSADNIPQVSIVAGSCTAGGAYVPTMSDEAIIVQKIGTIFLAGPPLVKAATGEIVSEDDLGGANLHCRVSGCTDYYAETEAEGYEMCRDIIASLGIPEPADLHGYDEPWYNVNDLDVLGGLKTITKENMYQILSRITDGSRFHEFKRLFGDNIITGFGFIHGQLAGFVCNVGPLNCRDAQTGAHFILMCSQRNVPLIFLQNSAAEITLKNNQQQDPSVIKERAKMISVLSTAAVPRITINIGGCHGDDNFTMCGRSFDPNFMFSWPGAETSLSWDIVSQEINLDDDPLTRPSSSFYSCSRILNDGIIHPKDTRKVLGFCVRVAKIGAVSSKERKLPVLRM